MNLARLLSSALGLAVVSLLFASCQSQSDNKRAYDVLERAKASKSAFLEGE